MEQEKPPALHQAWEPYFKELRGTRCRCGMFKGPGKSFCWLCWKRLPPEFRCALYKRIGEGYERAFDAAAAYLDRPQASVGD